MSKRRQPAAIPAFLKPRLRLFFGADIIGSTALKQSRFGANKGPIDQAEKGPAWFSAIQGFYFEAQQAFVGDWNAAQAASDEKDVLYGEEPILWKTVGDEVLFTKVISDHRQIVTALHCWMNALRRMRKFLQDENPSLDVKSTCWTAGFPFRNREVVLERGRSSNSSKIENYYTESGNLLNSYYRNPNKSNIVVDYIGPSIDTGFRLSHFASGRKMVVSVDIAYLISMTQFDGDVKRIDLQYDGSQALKGVIGGSNYPVFWVDMSDDDSLARREDKLIHIKRCEKEDVREYCETFYTVHTDFTFRPFIDGDIGQTMARKPVWYAKYHSALIENFRNPEYEFSSPEPIRDEKVVDADESEIDEFGDAAFNPAGRVDLE